MRLAKTGLISVAHARRRDRGHSQPGVVFVDDEMLGLGIMRQGSAARRSTVR